MSIFRFEKGQVSNLAIDPRPASLRNPRSQQKTYNILITPEPGKLSPRDLEQRINFVVLPCMEQMGLLDKDGRRIRTVRHVRLHHDLLTIFDIGEKELEAFKSGLIDAMAAENLVPADQVDRAKTALNLPGDVSPGF